MSENENEEQDQIDAGTRVELFLSDPSVVAAIAKLEAKYFAEFKKAKPEDLVLVRAKTDVLEDFLSQLRVVVGSGQAATATRRRRERNS